MGNALSCIELHDDAFDGKAHISQDYPAVRTEQTDDMSQPLSSYFISSGHNSYLTSDQLVGASGTSTIVMCLSAGCRVVELDVYNAQGDFDGPVCKHGGTLTAPVAFKDCIKAVVDHAFVKSPFPVIVTMENHTDEANQIQMAKILVDVLGSSLYVPVPGEESKPWKSPKELERKVLLRTNAGKAIPELRRLIYIANTKFASLQAANKPETNRTSSSFDETKARKLLKKALEQSGVKVARLDSQAPGGSSDGTGRLSSNGGAGGSQANRPIKALPKKFDSIRASSGGGAEGAAAKAANAALEAPADDIPDETINTVHSLAELYAYTTKHLMRVYPGGMRVDSSNYDPTLAWSAGASFAALNWQNWDKALWLNSAMFSLNGGCGYVLKPEWMRDCEPGGGATNPLPPRAARTLSVHVHSAYVQQHGNFACFKDDVYLQMDLFGMPQDAQTQCSKGANNTGKLLVNKTYHFTVLYPELAILLLRVRDQDFRKGGVLDDELGHWQAPVSLLQPGEYKILLEHKKKTRQDRWIKVRLEWVNEPPSPDALKQPAAPDSSASPSPSPVPPTAAGGPTPDAKPAGASPAGGGSPAAAATPTAAAVAADAATAVSPLAAGNLATPPAEGGESGGAARAPRKRM